MTKTKLTNNIKTLIDDLTINLLKSCDISRDMAVDTYQLAKKIGFETGANNRKNKSNVLLSVTNDNSKRIKIISVDSDLPSNLNRMIIARGLANYILKDDDKNEFVYSYDSKEMGEITDYISNSILLPKREFIIKKNFLDNTNLSNNEKIEYLSNLYGVDNEIVRKRIEDLKYVL